MYTLYLEINNKITIRGEYMKKLIFALIATALLFALSACGPNYTEEFNAAVDGFNADLDAYNDVTDDYADRVDDAESAEEVNAICDEWLATDEEMLASTKAYLEEIKGYEDGISDTDAFETTVGNLEESVVNIQNDIAAIPDLKDFAKLTYEFSDLAAAWEETVTAQSVAMTELTDMAAINAAIDEIIATDNEYIAKMTDVKTQLEAIDNDDIAGDIADVIDEIDISLDTMVALNEQLSALKQ